MVSSVSPRGHCSPKATVAHPRVPVYNLAYPRPHPRPRPRPQFFLSEPEDLPRAFNVLYVRTHRPAFLRLPLVRLLADTWAETVELLRPLTRLGIPESSLKDKCPYWR